MISIIIPTYNCAPFLADALNSSIRQSIGDIEVIVINDGSTDNTDEIIKPYLNKIKYFKQENKGLSAARNRGFRESKGDYICFLDADDILLPEKFEKQLKVFNEYPDCGVVISGFIFVEEDGKMEVMRVNKDWHDNALDKLFNHEVFPLHAALIKRSVLEESSLFPENIDTYESQEDWQLWLELALNGVKFSSVPEPLCLYRIRQNSIRSNRLKHLDGAKRVVNWLYNHPLSSKYNHEIKRLELLVETQRMGAYFCLLEKEKLIKSLKGSSQKWPKLWTDPKHYVNFFKRILTTHEISIWRNKKNIELYHEKIITEFFNYIKNEITEYKRRNMLAAAYLAECDFLYNQYNISLLRNISVKAFLKSPCVCFSRKGLPSYLRSLVGPHIGGKIRNMLRLFQ